jgi:DNA-binding NarL/FixJ family response regulator
MHAIFKRALMASRGERIEWQGLEIDPRYRFKTETIIELLDITPEEQKEMDVLISPEEKYRRKVEKRRKAGVMPRAEYEGRATRRRSEARRLVAEGKTVKEIGKLLDVNWRSVYRLISQ